MDSKMERDNNKSLTITDIIEALRESPNRSYLKHKIYEIGELLDMPKESTLDIRILHCQDTIDFKTAFIAILEIWQQTSTEASPLKLISTLKSLGFDDFLYDLFKKYNFQSNVTLELSDQISYEKSTVIGQSSLGTTVFLGKFGELDVAVKEINHPKNVDAEIMILKKLSKHENIVKLHSYRKIILPGTTTYLLALELCQATLDQWINDIQCIQPAKISKLDVLRQMGEGFRYLHFNKVIHRDVKPTNILIAVESTIAKIKIADFGISKIIPQDGSGVPITTSQGTTGWTAPEIVEYFVELEKIKGNISLIDFPNDFKCSSDIFPLGCLFYRVISSGKHPFGKYSVEIRRNIEDKKEPLIDETYSRGEQKGICTLITSMLSFIPTNRPEAAEIMSYYTFWEPSKQLRFLVDVSNLSEGTAYNINKCKESVEDQHFHAIFNGQNGWLNALKEKTAQEVKTHLETNKYCSYNAKSVMSLVRAIRNLNTHYLRLPDNVKTSVGCLKNGSFLKFWLEKFPCLLHHLWICFQPLRHMLSDYYPNKYEFVDKLCHCHTTNPQLKRKVQKSRVKRYSGRGTQSQLP